MLRRAIAVVVGCVVAPAARADDGTLARLTEAVRSQLDAAAAAHGGKLVPPVPIVLKWAPQKLGSLDLGGPIVAVAAADLDGDGKAEIYLVTSREVIAVGVAGKLLRELGRAAFTGEPAVPASRDVVGTAVVDGRGVIAAVSAWAKDLRVEWNGKALTGKAGAAGFRVCGDRMQLAPGRNHFREGQAAVFGARCRDDLVDPAGYPLHVRAELSASGTLEVALGRCAADGTACQPVGSYAIKDVGFAFEIADVDRDGTPDVIASSASAPGDTDSVRVLPIAATSPAHAGAPHGKPRTAGPALFRRSFNGGVAGLVVADGDGDGVAEVICVVRLAGATRVDLWKLDEPGAP
jgi:hypothetical protein